MDKSKVFINLSKCTEEEQKHIFSLLPDDELRTYLRYNKFQPYLNFDFLQWFICNHEVISRKTELTYLEFIKLFEGGESKEVLQVENNVFNIDFGGHVMAGLRIVNGEIKVVGAINGYGDGISADKIIITKSKI